MLELHFKHDNSIDAERQIHAYPVMDSNNSDMGFINYGPRQTDRSTFSINFIQAKIQRQGVGTALMRELVRVLGDGVHISSEVTHRETIDLLSAYELLEQSKLSRELVITDRLVLDELPLVKLRKKGGIYTTQAVVQRKRKKKRWFPYDFFLNGITDPHGRYLT